MSHIPSKHKLKQEADVPPSMQGDVESKMFHHGKRMPPAIPKSHFTPKSQNML
jgi:hypothetical protein